MTIKESLEKLDEILKNTESSVIEDNFKDIAEALEIDSDGVDTVEGMVEAIKTSVSSIEESDVEAVVEELSKFFVVEEDEKSTEEVTEAKSTKKEEEDDEIDVPVDELPDNIKQAVEAAVPGGDITEAELEMEDGQQVYEVTVEKDGQEFEVEVSKDGEVLEVELEEEEE